MKAKGLFIGAALAALVTTSACTTDPETGQRTISKTALGGIGGALGGYLLGDIVGGRNDRTEKLLGAGIGGLAGAGVGAYMDKQERDLRARRSRSCLSMYAPTPAPARPPMPAPSSFSVRSLRPPTMSPSK